MLIHRFLGSAGRTRGSARFLSVCYLQQFFEDVFAGRTLVFVKWHIDQPPALCRESNQAGMSRCFQVANLRLAPL